MGRAARTWGLMIRPKATTTPRSAPTSRASSTRSVGGQAQVERSLLHRGGHELAAPPPLPVGLGDDEAHVEAGLDQRAQRPGGEVGRPEEHQPAGGWVGAGASGIGRSGLSARRGGSVWHGDLTERQAAAA